MVMTMEENIKIKLIKSLNGRSEKHKQCVYGLGIKKINQSKTVIRSNENIGMINKVSYLLHIEGL